MNELLKKSATEQSKALKNKEVSAVELLNLTYDFALLRIEFFDAIFEDFIHFLLESTLR